MNRGLDREADLMSGAFSGQKSKVGSRPVEDAELQQETDRSLGQRLAFDGALDLKDGQQRQGLDEQPEHVQGQGRSRDSTDLHLYSVVFREHLCPRCYELVYCALN